MQTDIEIIFLSIPIGLIIVFLFKAIEFFHAGIKYFDIMTERAKVENKELENNKD